MPPIGRDSCIVNAGPAGPVAAVVAGNAVAGSSNRCNEATNRPITAGSTRSVRPKL